MGCITSRATTTFDDALKAMTARHQCQRGIKLRCQRRTAFFPFPLDHALLAQWMFPEERRQRNAGIVGEPRFIIGDEDKYGMPPAPLFFLQTNLGATLCVGSPQESHILQPLPIQAHRLEPQTQTPDEIVQQQKPIPFGKRGAMGTKRAGNEEIFIPSWTFLSTVEGETESL